VRKADIVLASAALVLLLAGLSRALVSPREGGPPGGPEDGSALFKVESLLKREFSEAKPLPADTARPGRIVFEPEEGARFLGLAAAHMCPRQGDGPSFAAAQSVVAMQTEDGLLLEPWVRIRKPDERGGEWYLFFAVWLETATGREWRTGWAPLMIRDLLVTGLAIRPERNESVDVLVTTADGIRVPGAMVSIDDARYPMGRFFQYAFTGEDGMIRISGLDADRAWRIALPEGVGPDRSPVSEVLSLPASGPVVLACALKGVWSFQRHLLRPPMRGGSIYVKAIFNAGQKRSLAPLWSVAPWIGPGRGPWCPFYLMHPAETNPPDRITLNLEGAKPFEVDISQEARIVCQRAAAAGR
jgi:hypothetical protein